MRRLYGVSDFVSFEHLERLDRFCWYARLAAIQRVYRSCSVYFVCAAVETGCFSQQVRIAGFFAFLGLASLSWYVRFGAIGYSAAFVCSIAVWGALNLGSISGTVMTTLYRCARR